MAGCRCPSPCATSSAPATRAGTRRKRSGTSRSSGASASRGRQEVPIFFAVASYLATVEQVVEVQGPFTSGEAEFALVLGPGGPWVTVASDQTDRFVERHSVPASKQLCPRCSRPPCGRLAEVEGHWDELELRAWVRSGRKRRLYQEAKLGASSPRTLLLAGLRRRVGRAARRRAPPLGDGADGGRPAGLRRRLRAGARRPAPRSGHPHPVRGASPGARTPADSLRPPTPRTSRSTERP